MTREAALRPWDWTLVSANASAAEQRPRSTSDGERIVDHENIQRSRLRVDARKWAAARLAPKKYADRISHEVKGPGANFQPAILIAVDGQAHDEFARQLAYDEDGGGNGDIVRAR
jgi:hypothetical protein